MLIGLYHCVTLVEMVTKHIWNVQFGVVTAPGECSNVGSCDGRWQFRGKKTHMGVRIWSHKPLCSSPRECEILAAFFDP